MKHTEPSRQNRIFFDFFACLLIILSHFANYILYAGYARLFPDILVVLCILGAVALVLTALLQVPSRLFRALIFALLITVVISDAIYEFGVAEISTRLIALAATLLVALILIFFLRNHASKVLVGAFLAMLFSTIAIALFDTTDPKTASAYAAPQAEDDNRPLIVHLILDEHMGAAGMTDALPGGDRMQREVQDFYTRAGFRLFSHAYSQYTETAQSLTSAMNFDNDQFARNYMTKRRYGYALKKNAYLKAFSDLGYRINLVQSNYIDFCQTQQAGIASCTTYKPDNLRSTEIAQLPMSQRVTLVLSMYYSSLTFSKLTKLAETRDVPPSWPGRIFVKAAKAVGAHLWHGRVGPLAVQPSFEQLISDISRARGGSVFFAHLLMPHYPYVYGPDCKLRSPISGWSSKHLHDGSNSPASRQKHYAEYFDQTRCVMRKLQRLFNAMKRAGNFEKSIIVIHGDHGARISRTLKPVAAPSKADYIDGFSILFAVKAPDIGPGTDTRMVSLLQLLKFVATRNERWLSSTTPPTVFLRDGKRGYRSEALPDFPRRSR